MMPSYLASLSTLPRALVSLIAKCATQQFRPSLRSNMSASPTTAAPDNILMGVCEDNNPYFWIFFIGATVMALFVAYCQYRLVTPPTFKQDSSTPDFGLPFQIAILLYNLCLWTLAPQVVLFFIFHVTTSNIFPMQTNCACIALMTIPFLSAVLFPQATLLLLAYNANAVRKDVGDVVVPEHPDTAFGDKPVKTLFLGCASRGALLIDALDKEQRGVTHVEAHMVDYAHAHDGGFVRYNAKCLGVFDKLSSRFHRSTWSDGNKFILPFPDGSFDRVVVSPHIRNAAPVGEMLTSDDTKIPRMVRMLREGMRVLRTDGELFAYDQAANIVPLWADLRDAGFSATIIDPQETAGPIFFMKAKMLKLHCPYQTQPDTICHSINVTGTVDSPLITDREGQQPPLAHETRFVVIVLLQLSVYMTFLFSMVAVYEPLSIPTSLPMSTRLATLFIGAANGYPLAAYFSRDRLLSMEPAHSTIVGLVRTCLFQEAIGILLSLFFSVVVGLPGFLTQLALADTPLTTGTRSMIGIAISILLGIFMIVHGSKTHRTRFLAQRSIPEEQAVFIR